MQVVRRFLVIGYWQELMTDRLTEHETYLEDRETTISKLISPNAVAYKEITVVLRNLPLPEPNSQTQLINSLDYRYANFNI